MRLRGIGQQRIDVIGLATRGELFAGTAEPRSASSPGMCVR